jgi:hypothetical protein
MFFDIVLHPMLDGQMVVHGRQAQTEESGRSQERLSTFDLLVLSVLSVCASRRRGAKEGVLREEMRQGEEREERGKSLYDPVPLDIYAKFEDQKKKRVL